ncbi:MAG: hypothetical protein ABIJ43_01850 [Candidatus Beckwithbacteria bacterium]|nr:hypothetical protein [Patescibacteria group bacterium]
MTDEIKALNLNSDEEAVKTTESTESTSSEASVNKVVTEKNPKKKIMAIFLFLVFLGVGTGYGLYSFKKPKAVKKLSTEISGVLETGDTFGVMDEDAFRDVAEGEMAAEGIDGEGSHHLIREGGESKYVYLTSSIIDLDQFIGKKVKVWGETFEAQKAGWLMDVGRLEVL